MVVIGDACAACPMAHAHMSKIFHSVQEKNRCRLCVVFMVFCMR